MLKRNNNDAVISVGKICFTLFVYTTSTLYKLYCYIVFDYVCDVRSHEDL